MLGSGIHHGERHLGRTQEFAYLLEFVITNPAHVIQCLVDCIYPFVSCRMATLAMSNNIQHHQSLFGYGRIHACRFSHNGKIDVWKQGQGTCDAILSRNLFFGGSQINQVVALRLLRQHSENLKKRAQSATAVVATQTIKHAIFYIWRKRITAPRSHGLHGVDMGIEQQGRTALIVVRVDNPEVVCLALRFETIAADGLLHDVGSIFFVAAYRWSGNQLFKQFHRIANILFLCHHNLSF